MDRWQYILCAYKFYADQMRWVLHNLRDVSKEFVNLLMMSAGTVLESVVYTDGERGMIL